MIIVKSDFVQVFSVSVALYLCEYYQYCCKLLNAARVVDKLPVSDLKT